MGSIGRFQVVDLGINNLRSLTSALEHIGCELSVLTSGLDVDTNVPVILPGTGSFEAAANALDERGFRLPLAEVATNQVGVVGICLGAQLLLDTSQEGAGEGLGLIHGSSRLIESVSGVTVPVLGWRKVQFSNALHYQADEWFYFAHSYELAPEDSENVAGSYSLSEKHSVVSAICSKTPVIGVQFHPEKSGPAGLSFLQSLLVETLR